MEEKETLSLEERIAFVESVDFQEFAKRINEVLGELAEILKPIADAFYEAFKCVFDEIGAEGVVGEIVSKENRRVVHLALNHRKERVRKKNMHRLEKIVKKHRRAGDG